MINLDITTNAPAAAAAIAGVSERVYRKAYSHSANRAILQTRTFILKAIVEQGIKRKYASAALQNTKSIPSTLSASLIDGGGRIPLAAFSPRSRQVKTSRGVRAGVSVLIGGTRELVPGAFLMTLKDGRLAIYKRDGKARFPITQLFQSKTIDIIQGIPGLQQSIEAFARASFDKNFAADFEFYKAKENGA